MPVDALFLLYPLQREEFPARQLGRYSDEVVCKSECPPPRWHGGPISPYSQPSSKTCVKRHSLSNHAWFNYLKHTASDSSASTRARATGGFSTTGKSMRNCLTTHVLIFLFFAFTIVHLNNNIAKKAQGIRVGDRHGTPILVLYRATHTNYFFGSSEN